MLTASILILLVVLLMLGVPVAFSLAVSGAIGLLLTNGAESLFTILSTAPFRTAAHFALITVPMFILMAEFASNGKLAGPLFNMATRWLGHRRGGVGISVIYASAGFGTICGSSIAAAAAMSRIAVPEMLKIGYSGRAATGIVTVAGTLAIMIPPSVPLVIYGITTETSIGKLLIAGILPGLITALIYSIGIVVWAKYSKEAMPAMAPASWKEKITSVGRTWPFLLLVMTIIAGLYTGFATPSEIAAIGALGSLLICLFMRTIDLKGIMHAIERTVMTSAMIFTIIIGAMIFGYFLTITQTSQQLIGLISDSSMPPWMVIAALVAMYLLLGCFLDQIAVLLITLPLTFPLVTSLGFDPIWFGVIIVKLVEIGLVTPPLGLNAFVVSGQTGIPLGEVFKGSVVMLSFEMLTLALLLAFPIVTLWLPGLMF